MDARVRRVQGLRSSGAAGVHRPPPGLDEDEPCLCGTDFTCLARIHDDDQDEE